MNTFYFSEPERQKPDSADTSETAHWMQFAYEQNLLISGVWLDLFQAELGDLPQRLTVPGSGQFAVTSGQIRKHPRKFYQVGYIWLVYATSSCTEVRTQCCFEIAPVQC